MKRQALAVSGDSILRRLAGNSDESATLAMLIQLCRESPELRHWLWEEFGREVKVRDDFAKIVGNSTVPPVGRFIELTNDGATWLEERRRLREQFPAGLYGGLTWNNVTQLIRHYQAGTIDLGVFLFAHEWRKTGKSTPLLKWAGQEFLELFMASGQRRLLKHLNRAFSFVKSYENKAKRRSVLGYADRWKMHVLLYMLRHPRESYTTRELRGHLAKIGMKVSVKDTQRFCARHGIHRDMRAGRPRKQTETPAKAQSIKSSAKLKKGEGGGP